MKRIAESSLLKLAVFGIILYLAVLFGSSWLHPEDAAETGESLPKVTKQQAADAAVRFVRDRFSLAEDYAASTLFQSHSDRSGYLQKEQLLETYLKSYPDYPIDYFEVEINENGTGKTYYVDVDFANLRILGWSAFTSPAAKRQTVSSEASNPREAAERTMAEQGYSPADFSEASPLDPEDRQKTSALGTGFVYISKSKQIGEARLRLLLAVSEGKTTAFHADFGIPASFKSWQDEQNDNASTMTRISMLASLLMAAAALVVVIRYRRQITFRRGLFLTASFLAIYITNNFNMIPALRTMHSNGPSQWEATFNLWFLNIVIALMAVSVYFSFLAGRHMWKLRGWITCPVWADDGFGRHARSAMFRGYLLCLFILGIQQTLYFIAGEYFDVWAVNDPSDSVLNMTVPGLFPLMAWAAAISEEAVYRLFGIAIFLKLVRNRFAAVLIPGMIWALSHTQYPIYPVYTRFIEVTIIGLIFGYAFLKYGFMTVLFAHASMDSILMGLSLFDGEHWTISAIGLFYIVFPALIGWAAYWLHARLRRSFKKT
ncbi:CPBP family intramembrane metalloprotease [Paenibacillus doosanensis]|uniref:CPBP family intramembrane glutamic endopeptidase n=1 Tax=Paenibacillus doosanensis TaxID=1229154 RepID=UPI00217FAC9E|nr:type II CAAX endopeptidase family protein [Paenibacillus doosanensis]MCS7460214.1 CPBP family intramembrane metalloprotease [Paenibacillus doosanensis]